MYAKKYIIFIQCVTIIDIFKVQPPHPFYLCDPPTLIKFFK